MFSQIKKNLYFVVAYYFRFFASIRLKKWNPRIFVVTGSSGKTTLLHMIQSQLGKEAIYTHHANSSYGIPFHILGLERKSLQKFEWLGLFFNAPFNAFLPPPEENIYVVEADCDRPGEGKFLAELLKPEVTMWVSLSRTHSTNFDPLVTAGKFKRVEDAIAYEFGYFLENTQHLAIINSDSPEIQSQRKRCHTKVQEITDQILTDHQIYPQGTLYKINYHEYWTQYLLPEEAFYSVAMTAALCAYLDKPIDPKFSKLTLPPGRNSIFMGKNNSIIIDSSYNSSLSAVKAMLKMVEKMTHPNKWLIISDILELGNEEEEEHLKLADYINQTQAQKIILMGPRTGKYTYQALLHSTQYPTRIVHFLYPKEVLKYLQENLQGGELMLFKGSRFLEGVIEHLLANPQDVHKLPRRERVWQQRRKKWGL